MLIDKLRLVFSLEYQKKAQKTGKMDLGLAESRYRDLLKELGK